MENIHEKTILNALLKTMEDSGFEKIRVNNPKYNYPVTYSEGEVDEDPKPDVMAEKDGNIHLFELAPKSEGADSIAKKWGYFANFSRHHGAHFYLVVPESEFQHVNNLRRELEFNEVNILRFRDVSCY